MQTLLVVVELMIAVALIIFVLLQRSEGGALGMGGGSSMGGLFSPARRGRHTDAHHGDSGPAVFLTCLGAEPAGAAWPQRDIDSRYPPRPAAPRQAGADARADRTAVPKPQ